MGYCVNLLACSSSVIRKLQSRFKEFRSINSLTVSENLYVTNNKENDQTEYDDSRISSLQLSPENPWKFPNDF